MSQEVQLVDHQPDPRLKFLRTLEGTIELLKEQSSPEWKFSAQSREKRALLHLLHKSSLLKLRRVTKKRLRADQDLNLRQQPGLIPRASLRVLSLNR